MLTDKVLMAYHEKEEHHQGACVQPSLNYVPGKLGDTGVLVEVGAYLHAGPWDPEERILGGS